MISEAEQTAATRHPHWHTIVSQFEAMFGYRTPAYNWAIDAVAVFLSNDDFARIEHDFDMLGIDHTKKICDLCTTYGIDLACVAEHRAALSKFHGAA